MLTGDELVLKEHRKVSVREAANFEQINIRTFK